MSLPVKIWRKKGFSLIELLVVISIIGILIATATVSYTKSQQKSRDAKRKSDLKAIQQALELFYNAKGKYPPTPETNSDWIGFCATLSNTTYDDHVKLVLQPTYISSVPSDPSNASTSDYLYYKTSNSTYKLFSILENTNDSDYATYTPGGGEIPSGCTSYVYRYKVTNP